MQHWRQKLNVLARELRETIHENLGNLSDSDELWIRAWAVEIDAIVQDRPSTQPVKESSGNE